MFSRRLPLIFQSFVGLSACTSSSTASSVPNSAMSWAAVFGPMPSTPGTLSTVSPMSVSMSTTCSGPMPVSSRSVSAVMSWSVCTSYISMRPASRSCLRSLSFDMNRTRRPGCSRVSRRTRVAITSSASNPSAPMHGTPIASSVLSIRSTWGFRSSGGSERVALYSGKSCVRKVPRSPETSRHTAR